ncbi:MAG: P-loop NTPase [Cyanobacteria bacterium P01_G01_bin.67]
MFFSTVDKVPAKTIQQKLQDNPPEINKIKNIIAIASGREGVGKSTITVNIAVILAQMSLKVGLLDADLRNSKISLSLGLKDVDTKVAPKGQGNLWEPVSNFGVKLFTLPSLSNQDPLDDWCEDWCDHWLNQTIKPVLEQVAWGDLDYLIVNFPPGIGDIQSKLAQVLPLYGVVMIATAQQEVQSATIQTWNMFEQLKVPLIGLVENKSSLAKINRSWRKYKFTSDDQSASTKRVPCLGYIPLDPNVPKYSDRLPIVLAEPLSVFTGAMNTIAWAIASQITISALKS